MPASSALLYYYRLVAKSCLSLWDPMDCSPPGFSVHGILQTRILEWVAMPSSRRSSQPRDRTCVSCGSCISGRSFTTEPLGKRLRMFFRPVFRGLQAHLRNRRSTFCIVCVCHGGKDFVCLVWHSAEPSWHTLHT